MQSELIKARNDKFIVLLHHVVMWLMAGYLLSDMISGFSLMTFGLDLKFSLIYKTPLFGILLLLIGRYRFKLMLAILGVIVVLMIAPVLSYIKVLNPGMFFFDFGYVIKLLMPITIFIYFYIMSIESAEWSYRWAQRILWVCFFSLCLNFLFAGMGMGQITYSTGGGNSAGSTGFIYAGNELGAAFLVVFGYALHKVWNDRPRFVYLMLSALTVICGLIVATKTTMLAAIILVFMVPIVNERQNLYRFTKFKAKLIIPLVVVLVALFISVLEILDSIGLLGRFQFLYGKFGIMGIIWSSRDVFIKELMHIYMYQSTVIEQLFGQGIGIGLKHSGGKGSAEVDFVDLLIWFGFIGLSICLAFYSFLLGLAGKLTLRVNSVHAPGIFLVNGLLFMLSGFSGHIWISGTLGIAVGVINSLLWYEKMDFIKKNASNKKVQSEGQGPHNCQL
ncbi:O-antigen ligase family protein [Shewanella sp. UCD-KL12]|uniref:O-antigen ligase family protein n=1 Tax=Shewanella sp. UCD-KL12 TaxID=1917163 RepID=UPI0009704058|nr:O-antigen ligase family protein [Shewanella sp. UCD-KL12]